jgi:hypothetical protein
VIYFSIFGFLAGWLFTRLYLGKAMSEADVLRRELRRAAEVFDAKGQRDAAESCATCRKVVGSVGRGIVIGDRDSLRLVPFSPKASGEFIAPEVRAGDIG